jgi:DNA-binding LytR/AlgR family response regulator
MTTALIADDEPHLAQHLKEQLQQLWPELDIVHVSPSGSDAAAAIARLQPDLAFLDIQMPGLSGLEVAQGIEGDTRVVFVTAFDEYAVQAFDEAAIDYLLKPLRRERLERAIERAKAALAPADGQLAQALQRLLAAPAGAPRLRFIRAAHGHMTQQVAVDDVLFFRADDKYTVVRSRRGEHVIRTPIAELAGQLDPEQFCQVHRSILINQAFLEGTRRDEASRLFLRMRGHDQELPVSRAYVHLFKAM